MAFDTPQPPLSEYLDWTTSGKLQLPDFQRGWTWEDERIRSLLVTVLRGHPMGAVMLLETGSDLVRFKPKPIAGANPPVGVEPVRLLLDGQQRLTSLTQALTGEGIVQTKDSKNKRIARKYYVKMREAIEGDDAIDEAVVSIPGDGVVRDNFGRDIVLDLSDPELERSNEYFPLRLLFNPFDGHHWLMDLADRDLAKKFSDQIWNPASRYQIPAIELKKDTSKSAVATVFEKVNTGGVPLNVFELLTATFAGDAEYFAEHGSDFRLNDDWQAIHAEFKELAPLGVISSTDFLQGITLLASRARNISSTSDRRPAISAKRDDILRMSLTDYVAWRQPLVDSFKWTAQFLAEQHIFVEQYLPYSSQLVPLAVIRTVLGSSADSHGVKQRIRQWYWSGILGELYGSATETRFARDVEQVPEWANGAAELQPQTVLEAQFAEGRLFTLRTRRSAAYKGIYNLVIATGAKDWVKDVSFDQARYKALATDIHHIFPEKWCKVNQIAPVLYDSIVNKTPLAADTNRSIGGAAPSEYLQKVEAKSKLGSTEVDAIIKTHGIDTVSLRADDFHGHFAARREFLITLIESAMGKRVQREDVDAEAVAREYEDEEEDLVEATSE